MVINRQAAQVPAQPNLDSKIRDLFSARRVSVELIPLERLGEVASESAAARFSYLVAAGGDGTLNSVAPAALARSLPLGVLPLGTRNNFARDLKLPLSLSEAIEVIARGNTRRIDVAEVNGRIFLNNSSIGAYPRAVEKRELYRRKYRLPKTLAMGMALVRVFAESRLLWASIQLDDHCVRAISSFIFVGNNRYELKDPVSHLRSRLDEGTLSLFTGECHGFTDFVRMVWLTLRGAIEQSGFLHAYTSTQATIYLKRSEVGVSTDGEVWRAQTPLKYSIRPKVLEVLV